ncbi:MAG TPA: acyl-CoA synthetase [Advenella kashmirensis]|uniref:Acyl-CoA synthetase n=2 Tax=Advenella TaxID=290425 RepID=A0A356LAR5_9BURK|nr:acyl-CoA synthetase [Advenella kashmirensis]
MTTQMKTFHQLLDQHLRVRPSSTVLYDVDKAFSLQDLHEEADRVARLLAANGAQPGERLALWLPTCSAWLSVFYACARLGITVIAMNTRFRSREVADLLARGECRWLVLWPEFKGLDFGGILKEVDTGILDTLKGIVAVGDAPRPDWLGAPAWLDYSVEPGQVSLPEPPEGTAPALVYTTSGTTSLPKLVWHDQQTLLGHGCEVARRFDITARDVLLLGAPLCGAFGFSSALGAMFAGAAMVSSPVLDPKECTEQIRQFKVTHTFANNELLNRILDYAQQADGDNPLMTLKLAGFASFAPSLGDFPTRAQSMGMTLVGLYGSSEMQALVASQEADASLAQRQLPGGRLTSRDARVRARDTHSGQVLAHGQLGEIEIKAPSMMRGYLNNPEATHEAIDSDGYFRTGDLGYTLNDQHFIFQARKGDYLRLGGFLVNPQEVQDYIESLDGVKSCQVVGASLQGKAVPVAFVIAHEGSNLSEAEIIALSRHQLAGFKVPKKVVFVTAFPVVQSANSNKIQRGELQKQAQQLLDTQA